SGAALLGFSLAVQIATFVGVLALSLLVLRSRLVSRIGGPGVPSRAQTLIGPEGIGTPDVRPTIGAGRVNVGGEDWAARSKEAIAAGSKVRVVGADGIVLEVTRV